METRCNFMVNRATLIEMGFKSNQAARTIKENKAYLVGIGGTGSYNNRRVGVVLSRVIGHLFHIQVAE